MMRFLPGLALVLGLALAATASAKVLDATVKFKVKKSEGKKDKVVFKLSLPEEVFRSLQKARGHIKVNFYRGKTAEDTQQFKSVKWGLRKATHKWPKFDVQHLCQKGYKHLRVKVKTQARGVEYETLQRSLDLDCDR
jgi:heme-degrading monooxygenase HmoA